MEKEFLRVFLYDAQQGSWFTCEKASVAVLLLDPAGLILLQASSYLSLWTIFGEENV